jgi:D-alanine-D-alanine ligase
MMKKNVAIIAGGYSSEFDVSLRSAENLFNYIDKDRYNAYIVILKKDSWEVMLPKVEETPVSPVSPPELDSGSPASPIDKNNFSFLQGTDTVQFDFAYITIHGTPGEDGRLQGYFDMLGIPYSTCGVLTSALTFNKYTCNQFLNSNEIPVADSILFRRGHLVDIDEIVDTLGLPVFIKPTEGGSSFGITKVKETDQIQAAIEKAFSEGDEVMAEEFIPGTELTCGCYQSGNQLIVFPVTEVVPDNEFFDYGAKYNGEVQEITPARISDEMTKEIQYITEEIYRLIDAKGIIRIDYKLTSDEIPVVLEINTIPGMTATSFIPQQAKAAGLNMTDIMTDIIEQYEK